MRNFDLLLVRSFKASDLLDARPAAGAARAGEEVQPGQALATVEAMKMENILRAEKVATVSKVNAAQGASVAVDEVISRVSEVETEWE